MARRGDGTVRLARGMLGLTLLAPLTVMVAAMGTHLGFWDWRIGWSLLAWTVGPVLAAVGLVSAAVAGFCAVKRPRGAVLFAVAAVVAACGTAGLYGLNWTRGNAPQAQGGHGDVTSDPDDPPGFARTLSRRREAAGAPALTPAGGFQGCELAFAPTQVAPEVAAWALQQAGFEVLGSGVGRADGTRTGFWFGFQHDAVVRIRPGRTDVRVVSRQDRPDGGEACRLAQAILDELQARA